MENFSSDDNTFSSKLVALGFFPCYFWTLLCLEHLDGGSLEHACLETISSSVSVPSQKYQLMPQSNKRWMASGNAKHGVVQEQECYFAELKQHMPGVCIHNQLLSCQTQFWHPCPGWPASWGNTCKLGSSHWYLWKECYFESLSGIPVDGKKTQMAVLPESQACCVSTWPLPCSESWKSRSTELEHQEALQRSAFWLTLHGTCFSPFKTRSVPHWLGATIPMEKTRESHYTILSNEKIGTAIVYSGLVDTLKTKEF